MKDDKEAENTLLKNYFESKGFVQHNIESFNDFLERGMQDVVNDFDHVVPDILPLGVRDLKIKFGKIRVDKPTIREADGSKRKLKLSEARLRDLTYGGLMWLELIKMEGGEEKQRKMVNVGKMPIMVKSKKCHLNGLSNQELIEANEDPQDYGGYFIINGTERVVIILEDLVPNKILVDKQEGKSYPYVGKVFSQRGKFNIPHQIKKGKDGMIYISFSKVRDIPFTSLMKALGFESDKEITQMVSEKEKFSSDLYINLHETSDLKDKDDAFDFIGKEVGITVPEKRKPRVESMIDKYLLPHLGSDPSDRKKKGTFIGKAVKKLLLCSYGDAEPDDKDHYKNKRMRLSGSLMKNLFRSAFKSFTTDLKRNFERLVKRGKTPNLDSIVRSQLLTSRLTSALATGKWVGNRTGISQHLDRLNSYSTLSHLRRVVSSLSPNRENFDARDLHPTHWGRLCTSETPEGTNVGLRKNLAITSEVTKKDFQMSSEDILDKIKGETDLKVEGD